ncbi:hypothetical protein C0989_007926 [Termitomyces sp. Mn162]|nr:hypothetical protein C0989_007926 [Termitomyces sp. Mn162]
MALPMLHLTMPRLIRTILNMKYDLRAAERARERLQGSEISGRPIDVHYSLPRDDSSRGVDRDKNQQLQGTLQVTLRNSPSGAPLDDNEVRRKFQQFGDVKNVKPAGDRSDSRYVEFYDIRACEEAFDRLRHQGLQDGVMDIVLAWDTNEPPQGQPRERGDEGHHGGRGGRGRGRGGMGHGRGRGGGGGGYNDNDGGRNEYGRFGGGRGGRQDDYDGGRGRGGGYCGDRHDRGGGYGDSGGSGYGPPGGGYGGPPMMPSQVPPPPPPTGASDDRLEQARKVQQLLAALKQPTGGPAPGGMAAMAPAPPPPPPPSAGPASYYGQPPNPPAMAPYPAYGGVASQGVPPAATLSGLPPNILALIQSAQQQQQRPPGPPGQYGSMMMQPMNGSGPAAGGAGTQAQQYQQLMSFLQTQAGAAGK